MKKLIVWWNFKNIKWLLVIIELIMIISKGDCYLLLYFVWSTFIKLQNIYFYFIIASSEAMYFQFIWLLILLAGVTSVKMQIFL